MYAAESLPRKMGREVLASSCCTSVRYQMLSFYYVAVRVVVYWLKVYHLGAIAAFRTLDDCTRIYNDSLRQWVFAELSTKEDLLDE